MPGKPRREAKESYVLDAYSLLAFLEAEKGGKTVKSLLENPGNRFYISALNLGGEVYYILLRERGRDRAEAVLRELGQAGNISVTAVTWPRAKAAGELKAGGGISYADCFAAALAAEKNAWLVTGDSEFKHVARTVRIFWLDKGEKGGPEASEGGP